MEQNNEWATETINDQEEGKNIQLGEIYCCTNDYTFEKFDILHSSETKNSLFKEQKIICPISVKVRNEIVFMNSIEFKDKPIDKTKLKSIIIYAFDSKNKEIIMKVTNSDLNFEIPKNIKTLYKFTEFHVGFNKFDQSYIIYLYLYNNFYIIKFILPKKKFEVLYDKNLNSSQNSNNSLMLNYLTYHEDSRVFLYNKPNLIIFTYNYFKNINYEEKLLNLESINDKIKSIYVPRFDLKNVFIISHLFSLYFFDFNSNKMSKVDDKYKFLCERINLINGLHNSSNANFQYMITEHIDKEKKVFYLKLWRINLSQEINEIESRMLKIEFIQQMQFNYWINKNDGIDYKLSFKDNKIFLYFIDQDRLYIMNISEHDNVFVIDRLYDLDMQRSDHTLTNSDFFIFENTDKSEFSLHLYSFVIDEMIYVKYDKIGDVKFHNFIKCLTDYKKDEKFSIEMKTEINKLNDLTEINLTKNKIVPKEKCIIVNKLPDMKIEETKKIEKKERKNLPFNLNDDTINKESEIIGLNLIQKNEVKSNEKKRSVKKTNDKLSEKEANTKPKNVDKVEGTNKILMNSKENREKEAIFLDKSSKNEIINIKENNFLIESKMKSSLDEQLKDDLNQILEKNLKDFSKNINKTFSEVLKIFNQEKEALEKKKKINNDLFENISKLIIKNNTPINMNLNHINKNESLNQSLITNENLNNNNKIEPSKYMNQTPQSNQKQTIINPSNNLNTINCTNNPLNNNSSIFNPSSNFVNNSSYNITPNSPNNSIQNQQHDTNYLLYLIQSQQKALHQLTLSNQYLTSIQHPNTQTPINNPLIYPSNLNHNQSFPFTKPFLGNNQFNNTNNQPYQTLNTTNNTINPFLNNNYNPVNNVNNNPFLNYNNGIGNNLFNQVSVPYNININPQNTQANNSPRKLTPSYNNANLQTNKQKEIEKIEIESETDEVSLDEDRILSFIREDLKNVGILYFIFR